MITTINHSVKFGAANMAEANVCAVGMGWAGGAKVETTLK